jgi:hypothetical protein
MTNDQRTQFERALMRAHKAGIGVVGRGTLKATGEKFYAVTSATETVRWHVVIVRGGQLVCDCKGAQHGNYCQHRAVARHEIEREMAARRNAEALIAAANAALARDTALPACRSSNKGFSIWAS